MATYADGDVLYMERTAALAVTNSLVAVAIPTITGANGAVIRPLYLEVGQADANFNMRVNNGATTGTTMAVVAADLAVANRILIPITPDTEILFSTATTATLDSRWIYPAMSVDGRVASIPHASLMPALTFAISVTDTAANLTIPAGAVELVLNASAGGGTTPGVSYGVGASGSTPAQVLDLPAAGVSHGAPYRIFVNEDDVVRMIRLGDTNQTISGYWRLAV